MEPVVFSRFVGKLKETRLRSGRVFLLSLSTMARRVEADAVVSYDTYKSQNLRIAGHQRKLETSQWACVGDVDNPNYVSPLGLKCRQHIGWDCKIFDSIGFDESQKYDLIENCPFSCQIPCGTYTRPPTESPTSAPTITTQPSPAPSPAPTSNNCPDDPDFKTDLGLTCASVRRFDCTKFGAVGFTEVETYEIINACPMACNILCGTWTLPPSAAPSMSPTISKNPSKAPTTTPSVTPSRIPSVTPSSLPSSFPSASPSTAPSASPSGSPSVAPSDIPTTAPSDMPSTSSSPSNGEAVQALEGGGDAGAKQNSPVRDSAFTTMHAIISGSCALAIVALVAAFFVMRKKRNAVQEPATKSGGFSNGLDEGSSSNSHVSGGLSAMNQKRLMYDAMSSRKVAVGLRNSSSRVSVVLPDTPQSSSGVARSFSVAPKSPSVSGTPTSTGSRRKFSIGSAKSTSDYVDQDMDYEMIDISFLKTRPRRVKPFSGPQGTMLTENVVFLHRKDKEPKLLKIFGIQAPDAGCATALCFQH